MFAEWSAECSADDPVLVVPWKDCNGAARFVDLRTDPYDLYLISEAENHPSLQQALRALNAPRSSVFTAKCDAWALSPDELESFQSVLDLGQDLSRSGFGSYIDLLWRERAIFASAHRQQQMLDRLVRLATPLESSLAALELVMRPALIDFEDPQEGYAVSVYIKAAGSDRDHAYDEWGRALAEITKLLRSREFASR